MRKKFPKRKKKRKRKENKRKHEKMGKSGKQENQENKKENIGNRQELWKNLEKGKSSIKISGEKEKK